MLTFKDWLLIAGVGAGLALAGLEAISLTGAAQLPPGAAALVNGAPIALSRHEELAQRFAIGRKGKNLSPKDSALLLERLVEEELLFQRAQEMGLVRGDPILRGRAVQSVIALIREEAAATPPGEETLRAFYRAQAQLFAPPARLHLRRIYCPRPEQAQAAAAALAAGAAFTEVAQSQCTPAPVPLPDRPLPPAKIQTYLGETLAAAALAMEEGGVIGPLETPGGLHFLQLAAREARPPPPFQDVRDRVADLYLREREDAALRRTLERLKTEAYITRSTFSEPPLREPATPPRRTAAGRGDGRRADAGRRS